MSDRFFIDANIFVYSLERTISLKSKRAIQLIAQGIDTGKV